MIGTQGKATQSTHLSQPGHPFGCLVAWAYVPGAHCTAGQNNGVHLTHLGHPVQPFGSVGRIICVPGAHVG